MRQGRTGDDVPARIKTLVEIYEDGTKEEVPGFTNDPALLTMCEGLNEQHVGAWLLRKGGKLREDFRLLTDIQAIGLDTRKTRIWFPMVDAAMRWAGLEIIERERIEEEWRQVSPDRVVRVHVAKTYATMRQSRFPTPALHFPTLGHAQPLGPSSTYPRTS